MLKKFLVMAAMLLIFTNVKASAGALINADVERVVEGLQRVSSQLNISLWGKEYLTLKNSRVCILHWGNSQNNIVVFQLVNSNNVQNAMVSFPVADFNYDAFSTSVQSGIMYGSILIMAGVDNNEIENFGRRLFDDCMADPYATYFHKVYTLWSSQTQRNISVDVLYKDNKLLFLMYAK